MKSLIKDQRKFSSQKLNKKSKRSSKQKNMKKSKRSRSKNRLRRIKRLMLLKKLQKGLKSKTLFQQLKVQVQVIKKMSLQLFKPNRTKMLREKLTLKLLYPLPKSLSKKSKNSQRKQRRSRGSLSWKTIKSWKEWSVLLVQV